MSSHEVDHSVGGFLVEGERLRIWAEIKHNPWLKKLLAGNEFQSNTYQSLYCIVFDILSEDLTLDNFLEDFQDLDV